MFASVLTSILRRCLSLFLPFAYRNSCRNCLSGPSVRVTQRSSCSHYWENWWSSFLPLFNGVSLIKASSCDFSDLHFATDASLTGGGAICLDECFHFQFPPDILTGASHISSLELYTIVVAVQFWAPKLRHRKFIVSCDNQAAVTVINSGSTKDYSCSAAYDNCGFPLLSLTSSSRLVTSQEITMF